MKETRHSRLLIFALVAVLFVSVAIPAYAALASKDITVFPGVRIFVDGAELHPTDVKGNEVEAFVYEGTTYVPLRAVSEALGVDVSWNNETKTAYLNREKTGEGQEERVAKFDAGSGPITYNCGPMTLSSPYCTAELDGFSIVYADEAFGDPILGWEYRGNIQPGEGDDEHWGDYWDEYWDRYWNRRIGNWHYGGNNQNRLYELHILIQGTVTESPRDLFLGYLHCFNAEGKLLLTEKLFYEVEIGVPFTLWTSVDIPTETTRIMLSADRID